MAIGSIFSTKKLELREIRRLALGHTATKLQSLRSNTLLALAALTRGALKGKQGEAQSLLPDSHFLLNGCGIPVVSTRGYWVTSVEITTWITCSRGMSLASVVRVQFMK